MSDAIFIADTSRETGFSGRETGERLLASTRNNDTDHKNIAPGGNPQAFYSQALELRNSGNMNAAEKEIDKAIVAAAKIDQKEIGKYKQALEQQIKEETDLATRNNLQLQIKNIDNLAHILSYCKMFKAQLLISNSQYDQAQALLLQVKNDDPEITQRPEIHFDKLEKLAEKPSMLARIWQGTKGVVKELSCDAAAVGAGLAAGAALVETGPGAVVGGVAAGAAAYTGMKTLVYGEKFSWDMPIWGAIDGISGGTAALARTALVKVGGKLVTKEIAENMASKTAITLGKDVLEKEGTMVFGQAVQQAGKAGLKQLAKDKGIGWAGKAITHVGLGNAEYRAALNSVRGITFRNIGAKAIVNGGTAATVSLGYRGAHNFNDYLHNNKYPSFSDFAYATGKGVISDATKAATIGSYGVHAGYAALGSLITNDNLNYTDFSNNKLGWASNALGGIVFDWTLNIPGQLFGNRLGFNQYPSGESLIGSYYAISPMTNKLITKYNESESLHQELSKINTPPANEDDWQNRYFKMFPNFNDPTNLSTSTQESLK